MKIGIYDNEADLKEALFRYVVANRSYTKNIDIHIIEKDGAYILDITRRVEV